MAEQDLWTVEDLARFLRKKPGWVYRHYREHFPFYRIGQHIRFEPDEIKTTLRQRYHNAK